MILQRIEKMLATEQKAIDNYSREVTVDFPAVRAELRAEVLKEIVEAEAKRKQAASPQK